MGEAVGVGSAMYPERKFSLAQKEAEHLDPFAPKDSDNPERTRIKRGLRDRYFSGEPLDKLLTEARQYVKVGTLEQKDIEALEKLKGETALSSRVSQFDSGQLERVLRFGTAEEKAKLQPRLEDKKHDEKLKEREDKDKAQKDAEMSPDERERRRARRKQAAETRDRNRENRYGDMVSP